MTIIKKHRAFASILAAALLAAAASFAGEPAAETLANADIIALVKTGLKPDLVIAKIQATPGRYDLSSRSLITLKENGVPDNVVAAMMAAAQTKTTAPLDTARLKTEIAAFHSGSSETKNGSLAWLLANRDAAIPELRKILADKNADVRAAALAALSRLDDRDSLAAIRNLISDSSAKVRRAAAQALFEFNDQQTIAAADQALQRQVNPLDGYARLAGFARRTQSADALAKILAANPDAANRAAAAWALGEIGRPAVAARPALEKALETDADPEVRREAAQAVAKYYDTRAARALEDACRRDPAVRKITLAAMAEYPETVEFLVGVMNLGADQIAADELETARASLTRLAGEDLGMDGGRWSDWFVANRDRFATVQQAGPSPAAPAIQPLPDQPLPGASTISRRRDPTASLIPDTEDIPMAPQVEALVEAASTSTASLAPAAVAPASSSGSGGSSSLRPPSLQGGAVLPGMRPGENIPSDIPILDGDFGSIAGGAATPPAPAGWSSNTDAGMPPPPVPAAAPAPRSGGDELSGLSLPLPPSELGGVPPPPTAAAPAPATPPGVFVPVQTPGSGQPPAPAAAFLPREHAGDAHPAESLYPSGEPQWEERAAVPYQSPMPPMPPPPAAPGASPAGGPVMAAGDAAWDVNTEGVEDAIPPLVGTPALALPPPFAAIPNFADAFQGEDAAAPAPAVVIAAPPAKRPAAVAAPGETSGIALPLPPIESADGGALSADPYSGAFPDAPGAGMPLPPFPGGAVSSADDWASGQPGFSDDPYASGGELPSADGMPPLPPPPGGGAAAVGAPVAADPYAGIDAFAPGDGMPPFPPPPGGGAAAPESWAQGEALSDDPYAAGGEFPSADGMPLPPPPGASLSASPEGPGMTGLWEQDDEALSEDPYAGSAGIPPAAVAAQETAATPAVPAAPPGPFVGEVEIIDPSANNRPAPPVRRSPGSPAPATSRRPGTQPARQTSAPAAAAPAPSSAPIPARSNSTPLGASGEKEGEGWRLAPSGGYVIVESLRDHEGNEIVLSPDEIAAALDDPESYAERNKPKAPADPAMPETDDDDDEAALDDDLPSGSIPPPPFDPDAPSSGRVPGASGADGMPSAPLLNPPDAFKDVGRFVEPSPDQVVVGERIIGVGVGDAPAGGTMYVPDPASTSVIAAPPFEAPAAPPFPAGTWDGGLTGDPYAAEALDSAVEAAGELYDALPPPPPSPSLAPQLPPVGRQPMRTTRGGNRSSFQ